MSVFLRSACLFGFFWRTTSGFIPTLSAAWLDSGYMFVSVHRGLGRVLQVPVVLQRRVRAVRTVQKPEIPQGSSSMVVDITVVAQSPFPLVQRPLRFLSCSPLTRCSTSQCAGPADSSGAVWETTAAIPQVQLVGTWTMLLHARCVQQQLPGGSECRKLRRSRSGSSRGVEQIVASCHRSMKSCR